MYVNVKEKLLLLIAFEKTKRVLLRIKYKNVRYW